MQSGQGALSSTAGVTDHQLPLGNIHDFSSEEARQLLHNKFVVVLGDSIFRSVYKDLVYILQTDEMLSLDQLKNKGEETFANDHRVEFEGLRRGCNYCEVRQYHTDHHLVRFYFITRAHSPYMESVLDDFKKGLETGLTPDVLIISSCLWDLNRYQDNFSQEPPIPKALKEYRQNLAVLFEKLNGLLPSSCLIIWTTAMPIKQKTYGSIFAGNIKSSPEDIIEANFYSACLASCYNLDVLDLHFSFRFLLQHQYKDGVHWDHWVHRCITKLLLTYMAKAWGVELEKRELDPGATPVPQENADPWHSTPQQPIPSARHWSLRPGPLSWQDSSPSEGNGSLCGYDLGPQPQLNDHDPYHGGHWWQTHCWEECVPQLGSYSDDWLSESFGGHRETPPHYALPGSFGDPYFQEDDSYWDSAFVSYEYNHGSHPSPAQAGLRDRLHFQPWMSCYGLGEGSRFSQEPLPGTNKDGHRFIQPTAFRERPVDGGGYEHVVQSSRRPSHRGNSGFLPHSDESGHWPADDSDYEPYPSWPVSQNATFPLYNGWRGPRPLDGYGSRPRLWPPPGEMGDHVFPPPRPAGFDAPPPPFPPFGKRPPRAQGAPYLRGTRGRGSRRNRPSNRRKKRPRNVT
ncbi:hypothetical protein JRQ81_017044 [Phrynocephalus forsythii]|uniref:Uncharacterized protein n=1 Tax=Phrynocephalus forsythii TaxID=171643 RepID=A0A9Q0XVZ5_9SAUR|nr:hypothetical protein JRQ81_017044 [Phrynocephalus forsythii]